MNSSAIETEYFSILERIKKSAEAAGSKPSYVTLIAVSKKQPVEKIEALYRAGHRDFGENYAQELVSKAEELSAKGLSEIRWHFIGHLQTNKVKALLPHLSSVHSLNSLRLAQALAKGWQSTEKKSRLPVFIEIDMSGEATKTGLAVEDLQPLVQEIGRLPELELQGLMCIPSPHETPEGLGRQFSQLKDLESGLGSASLRKLSMGMSSDFELAIRLGATHVRIGTALFGKR